MKLDLNLQEPETVTLADWQRICARITAPDVLAAGTSPALVAQLLATLPPSSIACSLCRMDILAWVSKSPMPLLLPLCAAMPICSTCGLWVWL